uniref:Uncharacterized protein n=1 Tax=Triticum urartu TaxID=4572 RepID=A0A8R7PSG7_TRIUA
MYVPLRWEPEATWVTPANEAEHDKASSATTRRPRRWPRTLWPVWLSTAVRVGAKSKPKHRASMNCFERNSKSSFFYFSHPNKVLCILTLTE